MTSEREGGVKSARRVLDVLEFLARTQDGATFAEISVSLGLPKSSLHGLLWTLQQRGWITLDEKTRGYRTGIRAWEAGQGFLHSVDLIQAAGPHLHAARHELDETIQLAVLDGTEVVYVAKVEADHPLRLVSKVGVRLPAHATGLGKVLLAALPQDELTKRFKNVKFRQFTDHTVSDLRSLKLELLKIQRAGYGEDDGEYTEGVFCVAAPVWNHSGNVVAAMSCSVPKSRIAATGEVERMRTSICAHSMELSMDLGWHGNGASTERGSSGSLTTL